MTHPMLSLTSETQLDQILSGATVIVIIALDPQPDYVQLGTLVPIKDDQELVCPWQVGDQVSVMGARVCCHVTAIKLQKLYVEWFWNIAIEAVPCP